MKWLSNNIDKVAHFSISALLVVAIGIVCMAINLCKDTTNAVYSAAGVVLILGIIKELYDMFKGGKVDYKDLLADSLGCIFGAVLTFLAYI